MNAHSFPWWQRGVIYQIYPRSFMDSDGDGVGDLRGIIQRLGHLSALGVDAIWLSPIFRSPMADFGYDVSDYTDIDPLFGTLDDFDELLDAAHRRGLRVILDLVPNHTSSEHPWFIESRSSRDNPRRDWYIWRDPKPDGSPPNNWLSNFGGPSWTWDSATGQYYLHSFLPEQPDLNWRNPEVKAAMFECIRFWLRRGVDGFRIDVIDRMIKDELLRDDPPNPDFVAGRDNPAWQFLRLYSENRPEVHDLIAEMRQIFDEFPDRVSIGEIVYSTDPAQITRFYGKPEQPELHQPFNFGLLMLPWDAGRIRRFVDDYDAALKRVGGWGNYVLGNHDQPRLVTRIGREQARVAALMLLTLRGTPYIYQGEELGLEDGRVPPDQYQDPQGINLGISRDPQRTPMPWNAEPNAGFSTARPWLPIPPDYPQINAQWQTNKPHSFLSLYRRLIALRRAHEALSVGDYRSFDAPDGCFVYERALGDSRWLIALNLTHEARQVSFGSGAGMIVVSTYPDQAETVSLDQIDLRPDEGLLIKLLTEVRS